MYKKATYIKLKVVELFSGPHTNYMHQTTLFLSLYAHYMHRNAMCTNPKSLTLTLQANST
jgi:hypothetical protein